MVRDDEESSTTRRDVLDDAIRYWERGRVVYNLALAGLVITWVVVTWPHFRPAFTLLSLLRLLVLAAIANVCYTTAYLIDIPVQHSSCRVVWRRSRWVLWVQVLFARTLASPHAGGHSWACEYRRRSTETV